MAGELSYAVSRSVSGNGPTVGSVQVVIPADTGKPFQKTIPANTTNGEADWTCDVSTIQAIGLEANKACTILTNSSVPTSADDTIVLKANQALVWALGDANDCFLTVDVVKFYITTGSEDTVVKINCGVDSTPVL